jgi:hypothetical protein
MRSQEVPRGATAVPVRSGLLVVIHESELCLCVYRHGTGVSDSGTPGGTPAYGGRESEASLKKKTKTARKYVKCEMSVNVRICRHV